MLGDIGVIVVSMILGHVSTTTVTKAIRHKFLHQTKKENAYGVMDI